MDSPDQSDDLASAFGAQTARSPIFINTLQIAFGWSDAHLNLFHIHGQDYGVYHDGGISFSTNPNQVRLRDFKFRINERFSYEYDFGDCWQHEVRVEAIARLMIASIGSVSGGQTCSGDFGVDR